MAEIYGKRDRASATARAARCTSPTCRQGMLGANGIVGGGPPLVCGVGLTAKVTRHRPGRRLVHRRRRLQPGHVPREPEPRGRLAPARGLRRREQRLRRVDVAQLPPERHRRGQARRRLRPARHQRRRLRLLRRPRGGRRGHRARALRRRADARRVQGHALLRPLRGRPADLPRRRARSRSCAARATAWTPSPAASPRPGIVERRRPGRDRRGRRDSSSTRPWREAKAAPTTRRPTTSSPTSTSATEREHSHGAKHHLPAGHQRGARARRWSATRPSCSWARTSPAAWARRGEDDAWGGVLGVTKGLYRPLPRPRPRHADQRVGLRRRGGGRRGRPGCAPWPSSCSSTSSACASTRSSTRRRSSATCSAARPMTPMVIRTMCGAGIRAASQHSQSLYPIFTHIPGLKVVAPVERPTTPRAC